MPPEPLVLAFDTSAAHVAAALLSGGRVLGERLETMNRGQAERLFGVLQELLAAHGRSWGDLSRIGVGIGPGNFTGIRISVSAARGLALSLAIPAIGVSTFQALAHGTPRPVTASVDGRGGRLYLQSFANDGADQPLSCTPASLPDLGGPGHQVIGHDSDTLARQTGATACPPAHPLAVAIALVANAADSREHARPAPLYMRAPDAAPAQNRAPVILP